MELKAFHASPDIFAESALHDPQVDAAFLAVALVEALRRERMALLQAARRKIG